MQQVSWANAHILFDGSAVAVQFYQNGSSPVISMYAGTGVFSDTTHCTVGFNHVTLEIFNHAGGSTASSLTVDNNTAVTGDPGANNPGGASVGGRYSGGNIRWYGGIWIAGTMSGPNVASCRTFFGNLAGLSL